MFRNTFQSGFLSILYSIGSKPLQIWDKKGKYFFLYRFFTFNDDSYIFNKTIECPDFQFLDHLHISRFIQLHDHH